MTPTVYKDFLTNTSVAWFTAGVITPIFVEKITRRDLLNSVISITMFVIFLIVARFLETNEKRRQK